MTSHGISLAPIPPALAKPPNSRRPGTCWVKGCMGAGHTKWQDCSKTAGHFTDHNGPEPMDTTVSKHSFPSAPASRKRSASAAPPPPAQRRQQLQTPNLAARGYAITAEVLRKPNPVLQSSGYSKLASADPAQCASDLLHLQDRRLLQPLFSELQSLSGKSFTLNAAANDSGDNAHCSSFCSPSSSFMNELHSGHIWVNAPFTLLLEFVQHYLQCKQAAPSTTVCIVVHGFLLPVMRPFLNGMHILETYSKGSTFSMHRLLLANVVQWLGLTGLYTCSLTLSCLHTYHLLLVNSATLCTRQLCITPQLCLLLLLLFLTSL